MRLLLSLLDHSLEFKLCPVGSDLNHFVDDHDRHSHVDFAYRLLCLGNELAPFCLNRFLDPNDPIVPAYYDYLAFCMVLQRDRTEARIAHILSRCLESPIPFKNRLDALHKSINSLKGYLNGQDSKMIKTYYDKVMKHLLFKLCDPSFFKENHPKILQLINDSTLSIPDYGCPHHFHILIQRIKDATSSDFVWSRLHLSI